MKDRFLAKVYYLARLLSIYVKFLPYDDVHLAIEMGDDQKTRFLKIEFRKQVDVVTSNKVKTHTYNVKSGYVSEYELGRWIVFYKKSLSYAFKNRHKQGIKYELV